jgi:hypothetical protein
MWAVRKYWGWPELEGRRQKNFLGAISVNNSNFRELFMVAIHDLYAEAPADCHWCWRIVDRKVSFVF